MHVHRGRPGPGRAVVTAPDPRQNRLLAALPDARWAMWQPQLEVFHMSVGQVLCEPGDVLQWVYFPIDSIVSVLQVLADGSAAQLAVVGCEGLVGITAFVGGGPTPNRAVVQSAGSTARMDAQAVRSEFLRGEPVMQVLLRYTQALIAQMSQSAVCNRHHTPEQQLCRYLLLSLDRQRGHELVVTHELIANMLGLRRETITEAALKLQGRGAIHYRRGHITVLDRSVLERSACECYSVVKREYERLLPCS